ncbi:MAG: long-chain-acyl-CoA synthetase [Roseiarcus sp.]|jgi:fatty-acyl-CoA synthase
MLARLKNEIAYARGLLRALSQAKRVVEAPTLTIGDYLERWAKDYAERPALIGQSESFTYRTLEARANRYAHWALVRGLGKGDAVCLMMRNRPEYLAIWMGLARVGVATALVNTNLTGPSLAHSVAIVGAKAAIVEASLRAQLASAQEHLGADLAVFVHGETAGGESRIDEEVETFGEAPLAARERPALTINDTALFIFTSGTTGLPKAARITHSRALRIMLGFSAAANARAEDRMYICLPMYHTNGGVIATGVALSVGGSCYIRERFSVSEFWSDAIQHGCTLFTYVGELCRYLLNAPPSANDRAHRIRLCVGNGLRPDIFSAFQARFGIGDVLEFYAATEGNIALFNFDSHPGAVGRLPGWAAKRMPIKTVAFDVGECVEKRDVRGHCIECGVDEPGELLSEILEDPNKPAARFDGYADSAATNAKILRDVFRPGDSWFRTGDLLKRDARGYYYFVDRIGDTFRWKGQTVSTTEVAETIAIFPGVLEAIVYGVAIPAHEGRAGMAALVVDNIATFDLIGLRGLIAERLPAYARPVFLRFRPKFDLTSTFKPKKTELVAQGFDPARGGDSIFFDDRGQGVYCRVDEAFVADLKAGAIKL